MESQTDTQISGVSLLEYLQVIKRRRIVITQAFLVVACASVLNTMMSRPIYQAEARLLVDAPSTNLNSVDGSNPISGLLQITQPQSVNTQLEVLQSPALLSEVSRETRVPVNAIKVIHVVDTNVIQALVDSTNPQQAAAAANTLLSDYINQDIQRNLQKIQSTQQFVQQQSALAQRELNDSEARLENFKRKYHVADLTSERQQQIEHVGSLQASLEQQDAQLNSLNSQIGTDQSLLKKQSHYITQTPKATNPDIVATNGKIDDLLVQRKSLLQPGGYGPQAPAVKQIDAQVAALRARLRTLPALLTSETVNPNPEVDKLADEITDLEGQRAGARSQAAQTRQSLMRQQGTIGNYAEWEVQLDRLTRQHDLLTTQYTMLQDKLADLSVRVQAHNPPAAIIESATVPTQPISPTRLVSIIFGCIYGLFIGLCFGLIQEYLDDRINSADDAERLLQTPILGRVPMIKGGLPQLGSMEGFGPAAESYRILRTNINFAAIDAPLKTLVVTSTSPGEGKSTTALNLSIAMALDGRKVALVDTDLRRPTLHKLIGIPSVPGLTDVLVGQVDLDDILIENTDVPNLVAITCGLTPPNPSELLGSRRFQDFVEELKARYDIIIFDTPPVLVAADAPVLAAQMDGTVLVIEVGSTKNAAARRTLETLHRSRTNLLGICLNKLNIPSDGYYYYHGDRTKLLEDDHRRFDLLALDAGNENGEEAGTAKGNSR